MGSSQQFSLRWNNYLSHITEAFDTLRSDEDLVDVTLSCEGKRIRAHKMLLSACSTYFRDLFKENPCQHPVIIFRNVKFEDLVALIDFIYQGEVNVVQDQLSSFLTTAELLAVQGLSEGSGKDSNDGRELEQPDSTTLPSEPEIKMTNGVQNFSQHMPGTSNGSAASVSLYPVMKQTESPPTAKRRKWSSNLPASQLCPGNEKKNETENEFDRHSNDANGVNNVEPTEIPVVPNLKIEMPEYMEQNEENSSCSYSDSNQDGPSGNNGHNVRETAPPLTPGLSNGLSPSETKQEPPDMYNSNSRDSSMPPPSDSLAAPHLCQILGKPGPSGENESQDSFKGDRGPPGSDWFMLLSSSEFMCPSEKKPDFRDRLYTCKVCGKTFRNQNSCYNHMAIHRGTSKCNICECVLSSRGNMKRHMHNVHGVDTSM